LLCNYQDLLNAAKRSGDQLWPMPLHEEYAQNIKSKIADIKNIGDGKAGSITAALFLKEFVAKGKEWAHIDMAGPVWDNTSHKPTGYGVALLVDFLLQQARSASQHQQDSQ
jgi:leucyl aminopeptidase